MKVFRVFLDILFPPRANEALVTSASSESLGVHARARVAGMHIAVLFPYRTRLVRACVLEAKFRDSERAQRLLGRALADYLLEWSAEREAFTEGAITLIPIPLSQERIRERGYNQTERIARDAAQSTQSIAIDTGLLARPRNTLPQTSLGKAERRENLKGAFQAVKALDPDHTYIVFDDVLTTGSTLEAAMDALRDAGARRICGLALAH